MRDMLAPHRNGNHQGSLSRAIAGVCLVLWVAGSVSLVYGSLTPQWTTPHCPQGQAHGGHQQHNHCTWHCDGIDAQAAADRSGGGCAAPTGFVSGHFTAIPRVAVLGAEIVPRGPPQFLVPFK
jgi:hypothetical protein